MRQLSEREAALKAAKDHAAESEKRIEAIANHVPDFGQSFIDMNERFVFANPGLCAPLRAASAADRRAQSLPASRGHAGVPGLAAGLPGAGVCRQNSSNSRAKSPDGSLNACSSPRQPA
ncbi:hypothetical protein ACTMU2_28785 [Cupriavidus basilensis]